MLGARRRVLYVLIPKWFIKDFEWSDELNVFTPSVLSYFSNLALEERERFGKGTFRGEVVMPIPKSKHVLCGIMAFLTSCYEGFPYNRESGSRIYGFDATKWEQNSKDRARGRITPLSYAA